MLPRVNPLAVARNPDDSLAVIGVSGPQAVDDPQRLDALIHARRPEHVTELEHVSYRYAQADAPGQGEHASLAYRIRLLFLDRWNLWPRSTCTQPGRLTRKPRSSRRPRKGARRSRRAVGLSTLIAN